MATKMARKDPNPAIFIINWPSGSVIKYNGSADPDPKEILYGSTILVQTLLG
jgi:hypothetical protein